MLVADQFTTEIADTTSTGLLLAGNLAFNATYVRVDNRGSLPLRLTLTSTVASTGGHEVRAGESREFRAAQTSKFALSTTSTSTADHRIARVTALAG